MRWSRATRASRSAGWGCIEDAIPYFDAAISLSPHDPLRWAFLAYRALALVFARQYAEAERWAWKATQVPNCHYLAFSHRVAALGHLGPSNEVREAVSQLMRRRPDFSRKLARRRLFYVKNPEQLDAYLDGLAKTGIPEER